MFSVMASITVQQTTTICKSLGAAFQKMNLLRDMNAGYNVLSRIYFPGADFSNFTSEMKQQIEQDISGDFDNASKVILILPWKGKFGVYAYKYYLSLFRRIKRVWASRILEQRIRISDYQKAMIVAKAGVKNH